MTTKRQTANGHRSNGHGQQPKPPFPRQHQPKPGLEYKIVSKFGQKTVFDRPAQPEEIAPAYVFLASEPDSSFITGVVLPEMCKTTAG